MVEAEQQKYQEEKKRHGSIEQQYLSPREELYTMNRKKNVWNSGSMAMMKPAMYWLARNRAT